LTDLKRVTLGCGNFGGIGSAPHLFGQGESEEEAFRIMDRAWDLGLRRFDTADAYGGGRSETSIGRWLASSARRPEITTKTFNPMIETSLERLGVEAVDVYLMHEAPDVPAGEAVAVFEEVVESGRARGWGASNVGATDLDALLAFARPALVQNSYSLLERGDEVDVLPICREHGIAYQAFGPLAGGWLTGKYRRGASYPPGSRMTQRPEGYVHLETEDVYRGLDSLAEAAAARGVSMAGLALAWVLSHLHVSSIVVGPRRPEHLDVLLEEQGLRLTADERDELASLFP
jgi:aryl-alcohol dehydrogenase-like predicted oxidoreductase